MRPIWHFSLYAFKSYEQNKVDCPKNGKIQWPVPQRGKKVKYFKRRHKNYFRVGWDRLNICLTIRNHWKSGSIPTLKHTVEILNSEGKMVLIKKGYIELQPQILVLLEIDVVDKIFDTDQWNFDTKKRQT